LNGYLPADQMPDSAALLPAPPAPGSAAQADDDAAFHELTKFKDTARGALAIQDADLSFPHAAQVFACALGVPVSEQQTPHLYMLLRRTLTDAGLATYTAKNKYQRTRPFVAFKEQSCTPADDPFLAKDGSYPSGHTSIGWAWALVLAEIAPDRADLILQRGRAFGQSRAICGAHWKSDVDAGRVIGAAAVAKLHSNPVFTAQMQLARSEIAQEKSRGDVAAGDCAAQAAAISSTSLLAP
jgi:acid phosphatase (class A)